MRPPLLLLALLLAAAPLRAEETRPPEEPAPAPGPTLPVPRRVRTVTVPVQPVVTPTEAMTARLRAAGWKALDDGGFERLDGRPPRIFPELVGHADLEWREGALVYRTSLTPVEDERVGPILEGLSPYAKAMAEDAAAVGRVLAAWGVPQVFDGRRLIEADGRASYFGLMLHQVFAGEPSALQRLSSERLTQALEHFGAAWSQSFVEQSPDLGQRDLARAWAVLTTQLRPGETALRLRPYSDPGALLSGYRERLQGEVDAAVAAGDLARRQDAETALAALNAVDRERSRGPGLPQFSVPRPEGLEAASELALAPGAMSDPPLASALPTVLRVLDRINGTPLTPEQQETLIKSFPMGELVWRMGVQDLWRDGLTGRGVRVAVVDQGVAPHPELDGVVRGRRNFTNQRGAATVGPHGTHVAGIIHALAPDAEIRSYAALSNNGNDRQEETQNDAHVVAAIEAAVADGNHIVNLSLGGRGHISDRISGAVERFAARGVIFVVAAGNAAESRGGVDSPSVAPSAITVGNLDASGRMARSSSFGVNWDPRTMGFVAKTLFMAPGTNIYSTVPGMFGGPGSYAPMTGTSMASPSVAGVSALLWQSVNAFTPMPDPVSASLRVRQALERGSTPLSLDRAPSNLPLDQPVVVVRPLNALEALTAPVAAR